MNDPDFWRALAEKFESFDRYLILSAIRTRRIQEDKTERIEWTLSPPAGSPVQQFKRLALEAGEALNPKSDEPIVVWFERLLKRGWMESAALGPDRAGQFTTEIPSLHVVSGYECRDLELNAAEVRSAARRAVAAASSEHIGYLLKYGLELPELSEATARRIWGKLIELDGARFTKYAGNRNEYDLVRDAFDGIAEQIVTAESSDELISQIIPKVVETFGTERNWMNHPMSPAYINVLNPQINIWRGRKLQMDSQPDSSPTLDQTPPESAPSIPPRKRRTGTITSLIAARRAQAHMEERGWTQPQFGKKAGGIDPKTLRKFFNTGTIRKGLLSDIAKAMKTDVDSLISE